MTKRLLAIILATLSLLILQAAAGETISQTVELPVTVTAAMDEKYDEALVTPDTTTVTITSPNGAPLPDKAELTFTTADTEGQNFAITYDKLGVYEYEIVQQPGSNLAATSYDSTKYLWKVYVLREEGTIVQKQVLKIDGKDYPEGESKEDDAAFHNTYAVTHATVRKVWNNVGNAGAQPGSLIMVMVGTGQTPQVVTLNRTNNWQETVSDLPALDQDGKEIAYTWIESHINGYRLTRTDTDAAARSTTFTNTRIVTPGPGPGPEEDYTLTVYYIYEDGTTAAETVVETHNEGDNYNVPSPAIPGYTPSIPVVNGVMPAHDVVVTVIYTRPDTTITIDEPNTPLGLGQIYINVGDCLE